MAPRLVSEAEMIERLTALFRRQGFDGASLVDIAAATGLQKSSLYHRFPGGKQQMSAEVVADVQRTFGEILAPLDGEGSLPARVKAVGANLSAFYERGHAPCLLDALSFGAPGQEATKALRSAALAWIDAFAATARAGGASRAVAVRRAQDAVAAIEGGLVLARVTGDNSAFLRAIDGLPTTLLGAD